MSNYPIGAVLRDPQTGETIELTPQGWVQHGQQMPLPQADQPSMEALQKQAQDAQYLDQKAQQFIQGMNPQKRGQGSFATGPAYGDGFEVPLLHMHVGNPLPTMVGAVDPRMGGLESITNQAWVHMRPEGSGAVRGFEAGDFKEAFPGVSHWGPENQQIANRIHQDAMIASHKLSFIDNYIRSGQGDYASANNAWQAAYGNDPQTAAAPPQQAQSGPPAIPPPMQMVPNAQSPIGASPAPGVAPPPPSQQTPQQAAILNWTPEKGLHP